MVLKTIGWIQREHFVKGESIKGLFTTISRVVSRHQQRPIWRSKARRGEESLGTGPETNVKSSRTSA
jgi:hypothetical protein